MSDIGVNDRCGRLSPNAFVAAWRVVAHEVEVHLSGIQAGLAGLLDDGIEVGRLVIKVLDECPMQSNVDPAGVELVEVFEGGRKGGSVGDPAFLDFRLGAVSGKVEVHLIGFSRQRAPGGDFCRTGHDSGELKLDLNVWIGGDDEVMQVVEKGEVGGDGGVEQRFSASHEVDVDGVSCGFFVIKSPLQHGGELELVLSGGGGLELSLLSLREMAEAASLVASVVT